MGSLAHAQSFLLCDSCSFYYAATIAYHAPPPPPPKPSNTSLVMGQPRS